MLWYVQIVYATMSELMWRQKWQLSHYLVKKLYTGDDSKGGGAESDISPLASGAGTSSESS